MINGQIPDHATELTIRWSPVNTAVTVVPDGSGVRTTMPPPERFTTRLLLTLGALVVFMTLVDLVTGSPPALGVAVAFGVTTGLGLEVQAIWAART